MAEIKGVLFDFNGTLIEDGFLHDQLWAEILEGKPLTNKSPASGCTNFSLLKAAFPEKSDEQIEKLSTLKEEKYRKLLVEHDLRLRDGAKDLFEKLKAAEIPFLIATASIRENVDLFIKRYHLDQYMDPGQIVLDDNSCQTKGQMYLEACKRLNLSPDEALIFEDSPLSVKTSRDLGFEHFIWMGDPKRKPDLTMTGYEDFKDPELLKQLEKYFPLLKQK